MTEIGRGTFVVFFSNNFEKADARRLVHLRRYAEAVPDTEIKVLADAVFLLRQKYSCIMIVDTPDRATLESALEPARDSFHIDIQETRSVYAAPEFGHFEHCVFAYHTGPKAETPVEADDSDLSSEDVIRTVQAGTLRVSVELANDSQYSGICMVDAPTAYRAQLVAATRFSNDVTIAIPVLPVAAYFRTTDVNGSPEEPPTADVARSTQAEAAATNTYNVVNQGKGTVYVADATPHELDYAALFSKRVPVEAGATHALAGTGYVWRSEEPVTLPYHHEWDSSVGNNVSHHSYNCSIVSKYPEPVMSFVGDAGSTLGFDVEKPGDVSPISPLTTWLNDLLNTNKFHEEWEEDSYTGDDRKAYDYILSQIPGDNVPKNGTIKSSLVLDVDFPPDVPLSNDAFKRVKHHLVRECTYFEYSHDWFSPEGVFGVLNGIVFNVQQKAFTDAADQMESRDSTIEMAMSAILGLGLGLIGMVPGMGSAVAGAMRAIIAILSVDAREAKLRAAVSEMGHELTTYIQTSMDALGKQHHIVNSNWGTLKTLAIAAIDGDKGPINLTPAQFGIDDTAGMPSKGGTLKPPLGVVEAASRAWTISIYKSLISAVGDQRQITMIPSSSAMGTRTWTADDWWYRIFQYSLPASWLDSSKNQKSGFLVFDCRSAAPRAVTSDLFGPQLNVNPIEFFIGLNGWPKQHYSLAGLDEAGTPVCPIVSIG